MATSKSTGWSRGELPFIQVGEGVADYISFAMKCPCTFADVIREIARIRNLRVEGLPPEWESIDIPGQLRSEWNGLVHGSAREKVKTLTGFFPSVQWRITRGVLQFGSVGNAGKPLSKFDKIAGPKMDEIKSGRLTSAQWEKIGLALDARNFKPVDSIEPSYLKKLEALYQGQDNIPRTFQEALAPGRDNTLLRRAAKQRIHRAKKRWEEHHANPAH